jgi:hypothetical protein
MVVTDSLQSSHTVHFLACGDVSALIDRERQIHMRGAAQRPETAAKVCRRTGDASQRAGGAAICRRCPVPRFRPGLAFRAVFRVNFRAACVGAAATGPEWILRQDGQRRTNWRVLIWRIEAVA